jgi:hypothetical protein
MPKQASIIILVFSFLFSVPGIAQTLPNDLLPKIKESIHPIKKSKEINAGPPHGYYVPNTNRWTFSMAGSVMRTHLNFNKSDIEDTYSNAVEGRLLIDNGKSFRIAISGEHVPKVNLDPVWMNIKSNFINLDFHYVRRGEGSKSFFYGIFGITTEFWSGFYTGQNDQVMNLRYFHNFINKQYSTVYPGISMGIGCEVKIGDYIGLYGEWRVRVCQTEKIRDINIGINDHLVNLGLKIDLFKTGKEYTFIGGEHLKPLHHKHFFRMPGDKFHWF